MLKAERQDKARLIDPLFRTTPAFWLAAAVLSGVLAWGAYTYLHQLTAGLAITGMGRPAYWGIYIVNFIFLIGVSIAGTVITSVLYLTGAEWRRPIGRIAEATTVFGLTAAGLQIIVDMGRPDRLLNTLVYGRLQSPLLWDMASLTLYLLTSVFALYLSLMPDLGLLRDNLPERAPRWRGMLYTILSLGWRGNREQWHRLERVTRIVAILIIPIGVSLHTVTSWIFSTTLQPGWHSTILGPYFVVGAIFSGMGLIFILVTLVREISPVKFYIDARHYRNLGWLFVAMSVVWFYFTYTEHLTMLAGQDEVEFPVLASKLWGADAGPFWAMVFLMVLAAFVLIAPHLFPERLARVRVFRPRLAFVSGLSATVAAFLVFAPQALASQVRPVVADLALPTLHQALLVTALVAAAVAVVSVLPLLKRHIEAATVVASVAVVAGMWLERWNIIVPTVTHPRLAPSVVYTPTLAEWSITLASFALIGLLLLVFFKVFPVVSLWEVAEGRVIDEAKAKIEIPLPPASARSGWEPSSDHRSLS
jgi:Ni/Fe-hydrogenase subunit HybB-like protein